MSTIMHARHKTKWEKGLCPVHACPCPRERGERLCRGHLKQMVLIPTPTGRKTIGILGFPVATPHKQIEAKRRSLKLRGV